MKRRSLRIFVRCAPVPLVLKATCVPIQGELLQNVEFSKAGLVEIPLRINNNRKKENSPGLACHLAWPQNLEDRRRYERGQKPLFRAWFWPNRPSKPVAFPIRRRSSQLAGSKSGTAMSNLTGWQSTKKGISIPGKAKTSRADVSPLPFEYCRLKQVEKIDSTEFLENQYRRSPSYLPDRRWRSLRLSRESGSRWNSN